jgi:CheY-like chemotaxis protein
MRKPTRSLSERRPTRAQISAEQLASLSHEFRTPLNGVLGMARLLEGTKLTEEQKTYVAALRDSGQHLLTLVNDVLDFAKLGAGRLELHAARTDLESLLQSVAELLSPRAREKDLEIAWAAPAAPVTIHADESRLRQILLNFAGNAVKFTETGGVLITAAAPEPGLLRFTVEDTGPGVSESDRDRIFEAFAQAETAHADLGGSGLGLAIARRIARAMGGEVGVERAAEGGAAFWFEAELPVAPAAVRGLPLEGRRVGVASPSRIVRAAASAQIEACGGTAVCGETLADVVAATRASDVVLVDAGLAGPTGALKPPAQRKGIVLLAPDERDRIARYRRAGFTGYLIKPLRRASLAERVLIAAGEAPGAAAPREDERIVAAAAPGARILLVEDNPINALLAKTLLSREGCHVEHVTSGAEALKAADVEAFDLILMDMRMPGLSGEETAGRLREAGIATPIVALTANAFEDDRQACLAAGMDDFLVKPLSPDALRSALTRWADRANWTKPAKRFKVG